MKIFTAAQLHHLDQYTLAHEPISLEGLVARVARAFVAAFAQDFPRPQRILVLAGPGNNGADARAIAPLLRAAGHEISLYDYRDFDPLAMIGHCPWDVVVDGLFGFGLNRPLEGRAAAVVQWMNAQKALRVAIDLPSGLFADVPPVPMAHPVCVRAHFTYTFEAPKISFFFPEAAPYIGRWRVLPIGLHPAAKEQTRVLWHYTTAEDVPTLPARDPFAHKTCFGHGLLVAGSRQMTGAALLAAKACLRSGIGLLTVHLPSGSLDALRVYVPEALAQPDADPHHNTGFEALPAHSALALGPGWGPEARGEDLLRQALAWASEAPGRPLILDADALNTLAAHPHLQALLPPGTVLTPHSGELARLLPATAGRCRRDQIQEARAFARDKKICLVLKGRYTAVIGPGGQVHFNSTGNPAMATAGSGDVLTGILLALSAQGLPPMEAAIAGVYLHGLAGDRALALRPQPHLLASDLIDQL